MTRAEPLAPLWLHGRTYDVVTCVVVPIVLAVLMLGAYSALGTNGPLQIYLVSSVLTGFPHNWITWLMIMPKASRAYYGAGTIFGPFVLTALVMIPVALFFGTPLFAWALTITITVAYYHITRQHQGVLHACDGRYVQATGDAAIRRASGYLRGLVGSFAAAGFCWKLTGAPCLLGILGTPMQYQIYPLPVAIPAALAVACAYYFVRTLVAFGQRHRAGARFPVAHALVGGSALANLALALALPNSATYVTLALIASYHNLQYFAFCYTHHHLRAVADPAPSDFYTRWARARRLVPWMALPVLLGVALCLVCTRLPAWLGACIGYWFMTSHYFVDGQIWRRKFYPLMGRFASGRVGVEPATVQAPPGLAAVEA